MRWLWQEDPRQVPPQGDLDVDKYDVDDVDVDVSGVGSVVLLVLGCGSDVKSLFFGLF